jgi:hypothetical protein
LVLVLYNVQINKGYNNIGIVHEYW